MAQHGTQLDQETFSCSICLDLLRDPVTIPCGHSYCMSCIKSFWDEKDEVRSYNCPQCRQAFAPRPVLGKNTMLAALVEQLKQTGLLAVAAAAADGGACAAIAADGGACAAIAADGGACATIAAAAADGHRYAGPEDVACDICTGRKLKALKSCLECLVSYCENHLQPHYNVAPLKKHKLVDPSEKLQESICSRHDEVMKLFCRTDRQSICYLCSVDEHKGHDTVSAVAERTKKQQELEASRQSLQQRIQDRERNAALLQQQVEAVRRAADKAAEDSDKTFAELVRLIQERSSEVKGRIRTQEDAEMSRVKGLQEKLEQEVGELRRRDTELKQLSYTEDHNRFLHDYHSLSQLSEATSTSSIDTRPPSCFEDLAASATALRDKIQDVLAGKVTNISQTVPEVVAITSQPQPQTRADFLKYTCDITMDPNTVNAYLSLSEGNRKITSMGLEQDYPFHPARFVNECQVLSRESMTGRCYFEVERKGKEVHVAVAYKSIRRAREGNRFGSNEKSWVLKWESDSYEFEFDDDTTYLSGPRSSRVGVYLDHTAGILSFYSITGTMTLLHTVHTTFTHPLHAGVYLYNDGDRAKFCKPK